MDCDMLIINDGTPNLLVEKVSPPMGLGKLQLREWYMDRVGFVPTNYRSKPAVTPTEMNTAKAELKTASKPAPQLAAHMSTAWTAMYYNAYPSQNCKKEEKMLDLNQKRIDHLTQRLNDATRSHIESLRPFYNLEDEDAPRSLKQLADRIKEGRYIIVNDNGTEDLDQPTIGYFELYYSLGRNFRWRDPAKKLDTEGYNAAIARRDKASRDVMDVIIIKDADAGLAAVQEFEAKDFTQT